MRQYGEGVVAGSATVVPERGSGGLGWWLATSSLRAQFPDKAFLLQCVAWESADRFRRAGLAVRLTGDPQRDVVDLLSTQLAPDDAGRDNCRMCSR